MSQPPDNSRLRITNPAVMILAMRDERVGANTPESKNASANKGAIRIRTGEKVAHAWNVECAVIAVCAK